MTSYGPPVYPGAPTVVTETYDGLFPGAATIPGAIIPGGALAPADNLYPGPTTFPGGGRLPQIEVLYSTSDVADTPNWTYVSHGDLRGYTVDRGRESELDEFDAGRATIALSNRDRTFDPTSVPALKPMNQWWIRTKHGGVTEDRFKGYADRYALTWPQAGLDSLTVVHCTDETKVLNLGELPTVPPRGTYLEAVQADAPAGYWPATDPADSWQVAGTPEPFVHLAGMSRYTDNPLLFAPSETGYASFGLNSGQMQYSSYDASAAEASLGDVTTSTTAFAVELWLMFNATPGSYQVLWASPLDGAVNRKWQIRLETSGAVTGWARNNAGTEYTATSPSLALDTWHHIVFTLESGNLCLYRNGELFASTAFTGPFSSSLNASQTTTMSLFYPTGVTVKMAQLAWYPSALSADRAYVHYATARVPEFVSQTTSERFDAILDTAGNRAPRQKIGLASYGMQGGYMHGQSPLAELRKVALVEAPGGMLFVGRSGQIIFYFGIWRPNTVSAVFDDDGTDLRYLDTEQDVSESFLFNVWNVTREGGVTQTVSDQTSIDRYFERPQSITVDVSQDSDAALIAADYLSKYKDPLSRVPSVKPDMSNPDAAVAALARELGDKIQIIRRPLGGGAPIDQQSWIQKISEAGKPGTPLELTFNVSPV